MTLLEEYGRDIELTGTYDRVRAVLDEAGLDGYLAALALAEEFGGMNLYFPLADRLFRPTRNRLIVEGFTGDNLEELAKRFRLSVGGVRKVLEDHRNATRARHLSLLEE